ncbi:fasciclin domain-containing protein [Elioraea rosea]|uniref:fasciclin domain-containing protein n=1 Tax=Elioraea rosea TaxID=2492390 RepID=UPI001315566B|nr:fasciclin domain-containing protein [Elioraea rosea]
MPAHSIPRRFLAFGGGALLLTACGTTTTTTQQAAVPAAPAQQAAPSTVGVTPQRSIATLLSSDSDLSRFTDGAQRTGIYQALNSQGTYTVFAPTNNGWGEIPAQIRNDVLPPNAPADPIRGRGLIAAHVVEGSYPLSSLSGRRTTLTTMNGNRIIVDATNPSRVTVESDGGGGFNAGGGSIWGASTVSRADLAATNGIVHIVDKAVLP